MNAILADNAILLPLVETLGWTLLHFLWQGLIVGLIASAALTLTQNLSAKTRYIIALAGLLAMSVCPVVTFLCIQKSPSLGATTLAIHSPATSQEPGAKRSDESTSTIITLTESTTPVPQTTNSSGTSAQSVSTHTVTSKLPASIVIVWLLGVVLLSIRLLFSWRSSRTLRNRALLPPDWISERSRKLASSLDMKVPLVRHCQHVQQAIAVGFIKPMILIPTSWITELSPSMIESIIAHELIHIRRADLWVNLMQRILETLLFYHPAVWWLSNCVRIERELCCDSAAVKATADPLKYAETLEHVGRLVTGDSQLALSVTSVGPKKFLLRRIQSVLGAPQKKSSPAAWLAG